MKTLCVLVTIAAIAFAGHSLAAAQDSVQLTMDHDTACRLASQAHISGNTLYTFQALYSRGTHASLLELPDCKAWLTPLVEGPALSRISAFHRAFREKCGNDLIGDRVSGVFTGHFIRARVGVPLTNFSSMQNVFVIAEIVATDEDPSNIDCPK